MEKALLGPANSGERRAAFDGFSSWVLYVAVVLLVPGWVRSAEPGASAREQLLQQELKQQQIKSTTMKVGEQLAGILDELERNQIDGRDVGFLRDIRGVLHLLSEKEMSRVIELLQGARGEASAQTSGQRLAEAFAGQKTILLQLNQIILEYLNQQKLYEIAHRLKELADDQTANMRLGVDLANETEQKAYNSFSDAQRSSLRMQQIEQASIRDQAGQLVAELEKLAREIQEGPNADRPKAGMQQAKEGGLSEALNAAVEELGENNLRLLSGLGQEKRARDEMREIARLLLMTKDLTEALRQALRELDNAIEQQQTVIAETKKIEEKDDARKAENHEAEVVDATHLIRQDLNSVAPLTEELLGRAIDQMQEARAELSAQNQNPKKRRDNALPPEAGALQSLEQARRELQEQLARAEQVQQQPLNSLAGLRDLQEKLRELIKNQEGLKAETAATEKKDLPGKAPKQGALQDQALDLQQQTAPLSSPAAQSMGEAAAQMKQAQNSLASAQANPAAQQAAIDALQRADQQLSEEIAKLEQAEKELAQLEELLKGVKEVIKEQQDVQASTAQEVVQEKPANLEPLSKEQGKLSGQTAQLQQKSTPLPKAASHLGQAQQKMNQAQNQLRQAAPAKAQSDQSEALNNLQSARKEIENRLADLQEMLGLPAGDPAASLADASALIEKAQREVNEGLSQLQQSPPG